MTGSWHQDTPRSGTLKTLGYNNYKLAVWMYENQGTQRFGPDNRFYAVVFDPDRPEDSWKLKRDFDLLFERIDKFLDEQSVTEADKISFTFGQRTYEAIAKVLLITKP